MDVEDHATKLALDLHVGIGHKAPVGLRPCRAVASEARQGDLVGS
jgi:hypothetical protein